MWAAFLSKEGSKLFTRTRPREFLTGYHCDVVKFVKKITKNQTILLRGTTSGTAVVGEGSKEQR